MKHLVFAKRERLEWQDAPDPRISGPGQAIVRPLAVARCDLDLPILHGHTLFRPPFPVGHEFIGQITELSEDLTPSYSKGALVAVPFQVSCGSCPLCTEGLSRSCSTVSGSADYGMGPGGRKQGGAVAERVFVPYAQQMLIPLPPGSDPVALASLSDNIAEAWKMVGCFVEQSPGLPVMVVGGVAASIGLYSAALAVAMGSSEVLYLDQDPQRLRLAESLGARVEQIAEFPRAHARRFPLVADATGTPDGYRFCLRSTSPGGICTSSSIFFQNDFPLPFLDLYLSGVRIQIERVTSRETIPKLLPWIASGAFRPDRIVTQVVDFDEAREAWALPSTKLVVRGPTH